MYLVGVAVVSATEGAGSEFMNSSDGAKATWSDAAVAYGSYDESSIETIDNDAQHVRAIYNLNGQKLNAASGLCIVNGKLIYIK